MSKPVTATPKATDSSSLKQILSMSGAVGPFIGLVVLIVYFSLNTERFFASNNFLNILDQVTVLSIVAIGMSFVILIGGIDLSVGSVLSMSMMMMGWLNIHLGYSMVFAIPAALLLAMFAGLISGLLISELEIPPFIATLAMMTIARGMAGLIANGNQYIGFPRWFRNLSWDRYFDFLTVTMMIAIVVSITAVIYQRYRAGGRKLYAIGGNPEVARLAGINVKRTTTLVYVACAGLAGLAGVLLGARIDASSHTEGVSLELFAIAAVVIGGTSLSGGKGSIVGTIVGVLIIGVLNNGLTHLKVDSFWKMVVIGVVILFAVGTEKVFGKKNK